MDISPASSVKQTGVLVSLRNFQIALMISVFGFIKMKYGIEVIMACRVNASLSTTLINSSKFRFQNRNQLV
jgi:enoyl-[acyl-carrier-protein] reductase (NADH)